MSAPGRAERLGAYIKSLGPVVWGESDCCAFVAKWIAMERHAEIALPAYSNWKEASALIASSGGLVAMVSPMLASAGLFETSAPQLGDIGVVALSEHHVGAIFCDHGIAVLRAEPHNTFFLRPRERYILKSWAV